MSNNSVAFASCAGTLEDYFKSDICANRTIYCQFRLESLGGLGEHLVQEAVNRNKIEYVIFCDGKVIKRS